MTIENGNETPNAQGADTTATQQAQSPAPESNGLQKRFDELTAQIYLQKGRADALEAQLAKQAVHQAVEQPKVDPIASEMANLEQQFGSGVTASLKRIFEAQAAQLNAQVGVTRNILETQTATSHIAQIAQEKGIKDTRVVARAQQLIADWRSNGLTFPPGDALNFAIGEAATNSIPVARGVDGRFAPPNPVLTQASAPPQVRQGKPQKPPGFDDLPAEQQYAWYDKNGAGDVEF